jgi:hypothetical protein
MGVVRTHLVQVVCEIVCDRVPATIFKINQGTLLVVFIIDKDVVLLYIIVRKHDFITWH